MTYPGTRLILARASDGGVDVMNALVDDLVATCCKLGCRRVEVETIKCIAVAVIDRERNDPTGADVVDLVMGLATKEHLRQHMPRVRPQHATFRVSSHHPLSYEQFPDAKLRKHRKLSRQQRRALRRLGIDTGGSITPDQLRRAKVDLEDLYRHETETLRDYHQARQARQDCVVEAKRMEDVRARKKVVEQQYMAQLVNYMKGRGMWTRAKGQQVMRKYREGEFEAAIGFNHELLDLCPPGI